MFRLHQFGHKLGIAGKDNKQGTLFNNVLTKQFKYDNYVNTFASKDKNVLSAKSL